MTKYSALGDFLTSSGRLEMKLSFKEIEKILGFKLPYSANNYAAWWANGGHSQAESWINAGFLTKELDILNGTVMFCKKEAQHHPEQKAKLLETDFVGTEVKESDFQKQDCDILSVCGYEFQFIQQLIPECKEGRVIEYYPQEAYNNQGNLPLLTNGKGAFCRFSVQAPAASGVYLWVADGVIIYIGETANLRKRFNLGYGNISPRNCYVGGQSTNCKMNKVVMEYYQCGNPVNLYFYQTATYKQVEHELLNRISTKYNVKENGL